MVSINLEKEGGRVGTDRRLSDGPKFWLRKYIGGLITHQGGDRQYTAGLSLFKNNLEDRILDVLITNVLNV